MLRKRGARVIPLGWGLLCATALSCADRSPPAAWPEPQPPSFATPLETTEAAERSTTTREDGTPEQASRAVEESASVETPATGGDRARAEGAAATTDGETA